MVEYNATVEHHPNSQGYPGDVMLTFLHFYLYSNVVEYNATVEHHPSSQRYAENVKVTWMTPPYVKFKSGSASHSANILNNNAKGVPQFEVKTLLSFVKC